MNWSFFSLWKEELQESKLAVIRSCNRKKRWKMIKYWIGRCAGSEGGDCKGGWRGCAGNMGEKTQLKWKRQEWVEKGMRNRDMLYMGRFRSAFWVYVVRGRCVESYRAFEALAVVVVVEGLHPAVTSLNWEATAHALGCEQIIPVCQKRRLYWLRVSMIGKDHLYLATMFFSAFVIDMLRGIPVHQSVIYSALCLRVWEGCGFSQGHSPVSQ